MMTNSLPKLEFDKKRNRVECCPCGKKNKDGKFVPYVGHEKAGYCHSCGETFLPALPKTIKTWEKPSQFSRPIVRPKKPIDFIPPEKFKSLLIGGEHLYPENHFVQWLGSLDRGENAFDPETIGKLIGGYFLGNSAKYQGWVLFPYIDIKGNVRDIKAMDYNLVTGKRISMKNGDPQNRCLFIGKKLLNKTDANTERCFFGEHLLRGNSKIARIFESEATAVYAAPFFPESICIATGVDSGDVDHQSGDVDHPFPGGLLEPSLWPVFLTKLFDFSQGLTGELYSMCFVYDPVQDRVSDRSVSNGLMPFFDW